MRLQQLRFVRMRSAGRSAGAPSAAVPAWGIPPAMCAKPNRYRLHRLRAKPSVLRRRTPNRPAAEPLSRADDPGSDAPRMHDRLRRTSSPAAHTPNLRRAQAPVRAHVHVRRPYGPALTDRPSSSFPSPASPAQYRPNNSKAIPADIIGAPIGNAHSIWECSVRGLTSLARHPSKPTPLDVAHNGR